MVKSICHVSLLDSSNGVTANREPRCSGRLCFCESGTPGLANVVLIINSGFKDTNSVHRIILNIMENAEQIYNKIGSNLLFNGSVLNKIMFDTFNEIKQLAADETKQLAADETNQLAADMKLPTMCELEPGDVMGQAKRIRDSQIARQKPVATVAVGKSGDTARKHGSIPQQYLLAQRVRSSRAKAKNVVAGVAAKAGNVRQAIGAYAIEGLATTTEPGFQSLSASPLSPSFPLSPLSSDSPAQSILSSSPDNTGSVGSPADRAPSASSESSESSSGTSGSPVFRKRKSESFYNLGELA